MKTPYFLLISIFLAFTNSFSAQTVNGIPLKDLDVEYIRIFNGLNFRNPPIYIDFGEGRVSISTSKSNILLDENKQPIVFKHVLDALNFMAKHGFELVEAYVAAYEEGRDGHFYILRRKKQP